MRILHTADWHLGARLVERNRLSEQAAWIEWLLGVVRTERIDLVLVSGDVFDAAGPPQEAVALYYDFIRRLSEISGVSAIITGGNHDSASHLNAPRDLLERFRVRVFGSSPADPAACLVGFDDVLVAAVPYLRERDLRQAIAGESSLEAHEAVKQAMRAHYASVRSAAGARAGSRPIMAMGHLTTQGAASSDSERLIHVGNLGAVGPEIFDGFDYVALGHLHRPQVAGSATHIRYSGAPIALSFSEAGDVKSVAVVEISPPCRVPVVELLPVPVTQQLVRVVAPWRSLADELRGVPERAWAEVTVIVDEPQIDIERQVREAAAGRCDVVKVLVMFPTGRVEPWRESAPPLEQLQPLEVFRARLRAAGLPEDEPDLIDTFHELLALHEAASTA
jgi:DNA repair protein SbcD/Mre11